uniref:IMD domain-containing protein n=1 Tax=Trichobilharzia regenti TaxID=157069 RepID=A0AA85JB74_TRIRE|nr:unnamed protein product [Trichobilharzia regenti]
MDNSQVYSDDVVNIANSLLNDLKNSYQTWEDLVSKCGKFHSALKAATQASSAFLDAFQKVADLATKTYGGSKEIGACLTRYCMRQKSLESKVKSMSNHLVTSLANPLSSKVDEWRRNLYQLEKDRTRQTKRVRAELKKAVAEAQKWEKKAAKIGIIGSGGVGPGVGHGIIPSSNLACSNSESNAINIQAAKAAREVGIKKELVENTEKSAIRLLLLEERSRFCFFVSCLLPILECQSSMLNEIATMDELIRALTKETEYPNQLVEDVESIVLRMGRRDISVSSRGSNKTMSLFVSDSGDKTSTSNEVLGGLYMTNGNRSCVTSSDTESGRHGADMMLPFQLRRDTNSVGRCNSVCDSGDISLCGTSSHSGSGGSNCPSLLSPVRHNIARLGSRESSLMSVDSAASGSGNANPSYSIGISNTNMMHSDSEENQFKTLCRPGHCRAASNGDTDFPKHLKNGFRYDRPDCMIAKSMIAFNPQAEISESITTNGKSCPVNNDAEHKNANEDVMETHSCLDHDESNGGSDDDAEEEEEDDGGGEDGGEYVEVGGKTTHLPDESTSVLSGNLSQQYSLDNYTPNTSGPGGGGGSGDPSVPSNGRHTISSAYERGCHAPTRASITALSFNPPVGKASSKDSGVDSSAVLYPKQAVPPPVYTNLTQLTHAAQRKFSMSQLPIVHSYENVDNTLERLQYVKSDLKTNCHHFPHQLAHPNSIPTSTSQNQAMNSAQQINNATTTATATSNNTNGNWSVTSSLSKLNLNDSELNQSRGEEKYANPSGLLQSKVDKLSSNTSLSSSCFSSKHQLDGVSISGSTSVASGAVGNMPSCHQTNGADPFSMEMEELDQMLPGSSRGSSLTMASSTTNDSLPSSNGSPALVSYHANARRSIPSNPPCSQSSLVNEQLLENKLHYATPVIPSSSQCCSPASQVSSLLRHSENLPIANSSSLPPAPPPPPPLPVFSIPSSTTLSSSSYSPIEVNPANSPCYNVKSSTADSVSVETANLMSELSSQLAQLAARSNDIHYSPAKTNRISTVNNNESDKEYVKYDEFDLPPPPPSSMFNDELCCYTGQIKQNYPLNQQLTDVTVAMTATPSTTTGTVTPVVASGTPTTATSATKDDQEEESSENLSPFLLALKQSVKQRANRLANQNSIVN